MLSDSRAVLLPAQLLGAISRVDIPVCLVEQFGDWDDAVALFGSMSDYFRQGVGGMETVVMKKDDGAGVQAACDALDHLLSADISPVQGVNAPLDGEISQFVCSFNNFIAVFTKRRPEKLGLHFCQLDECGVDKLKLLFNFWLV